jgi:hypothetical protein
MGKKDERYEVRYDYRETDTGKTGSGTARGTKDEIRDSLLEISKGGDVEITPPK